MPAIQSTTRATIKAYLEVFIENLVEQYRDRTIALFETPATYLEKRSSKGHLKPFHAALIPPEMLRITAFERGLSTGLGTTFEECARLIALEHHAQAHWSYDFTGEISLSAINEIERQVALFERVAEQKGTKPSLEEMIDAVLNARASDDWVSRTVRAVLYIKAYSGTELFFEIKSPVPNKGQCLEVTQRILRFHLLRGRNRPDVQAYFAMAYNPYGPRREDYNWSMAQNYTPFKQAIVIGSEFWKSIGDPTTYQELLEIYREVGHDKSKYMIDALAFGF